ncbi:hypothetical protein [Cellulosimicrobium sp. NPDC057127]|uniref:hypothetical protein n=1 Tax=Cellulosimicrobium sp. NPDC057127 TaxID=3346026 RepID=UPI00364061E7
MRHASLTSGVAAFPLIAGFGLPPLYFVLGLSWLDGHVAASLPVASLLGALGIYATGEATWPRPLGTQREARLTLRSVADIASRGLRRLVWVSSAAIGATSVLFGVVASGPRSVSRVFDLYQAHTVGPFPGWLWTAPILVGTALVVVLLELVLRFIAARPAVEDVSEEWDMWLRRRVARRVQRTVQLVLGLTLSGVLGLAGLAFRWLGLGTGSGAYTNAPTSHEHATAGSALLAIALAVAVAAAVAAVWPAHDRAPDPLTADEPVGTRA